MLEMQHTSLGRELRFALRRWARTPGFAAVAVVTLALGIGVGAALFSVVNAVLLRSFGYAEPNRLIEISGQNRQSQPTGVSAADFQAIRQRAHAFASVGAAKFQAFTLVGSHEPESLYGQLVTADCFTTLGAHPLLGRVFAETDFQPAAPSVAILSYKLWQRSFGVDPRVIGRHVFLDGVDFSVVGVMPPEFQFPHPAFQLWAPSRITAAELDGRRIRTYQLVARLRPGVSTQTAQAELQSLSAALAREFPNSNAGWRAVMSPMNDQLLGKLRPALLTMLGAVGFVLLIACLNVSNLLMARGIGRTRELAIHAALGAPRLRLAVQLLAESLVLAVTGGLLGLLVARACLFVLLRLLPVRAVPIFPRMEEATLDARVLAVALAVTLLTGILFGLLPAWQFSRPELEPALHEGGRGATGSRRRKRLLSGLIALEAALSVILLAGAGLLLRSFLNRLDVLPGFHPEHVLTAAIPSPWKPGAANNPAELARKVRYLHEVLDRAQRIPGVSTAALTTNLPLSSVQVQTIVRPQGHAPPQPGEEFRVGYSSVSASYFATMAIPLLRGRAFTESDTADQPLAAIVNEAMARRFWPNEDALGKQITFNPAAPAAGPWMTVVGIAGNVRRFSLTAEPDAQIYASYAQSMFSPQTATLVLRTPLDPASLAAALPGVIHQIDPNQPVAEVKPMSQIVWDSMAQTRIYTVMLGIFAALALALAAAGVFSAISWMVSQSTHEIGIRVALGATSRNLLTAMMTRALIETLAGAVAGVLGATALTGFLKSQLYQVTALDPAVFIAAPLLLVLAALAAAYLSARRATRVDPMVALR
jgi:putative ABC transport system permease protein